MRFHCGEETKLFNLKRLKVLKLEILMALLSSRQIQSGKTTCVEYG